MRQLGARSLPVVAQGERWLWASNLRDLAAFLDVGDRMDAALPPGELLARWLHFLTRAQRFAAQLAQLPAGALGERVIPVRPRTVGMLGAHIFKIAENFLDALETGIPYSGPAADVLEGDPHTHDAADMAAYGQVVVERVQAWQRQFNAEVARTPIPTITGDQPVAKVLERCTCHSGQHTRQLQHVLETAGIAPDGPIRPEHLAKLPMPQRLFE
jgi:hypothetical protein